MLELFTKKPIFQGNDEIHQLDVIYRILGTPTPERWPGVSSLPWYELVKPKEVIPNQFRELFKKLVSSNVGMLQYSWYSRWLSPAALDLAEQLLAYDPAQRVTAAQALEAPYFNQEQPPAERPVGCVSLTCSHYVLSHYDLVWLRWRASGTSSRRSASARRSGARRREAHNESVNDVLFFLIYNSLSGRNALYYCLHILLVILLLSRSSLIPSTPRIAGL